MNLIASYTKRLFNKEVSECTNQELYKALLDLVRDRSAELKLHEEKKKLYYFSAEFLIGKLLSNNILNLGLYDEIDEELKAAGSSLSLVEEAEHEPSLGNGGLGRLAACFMDSLSTLKLNADGVGLSYHFGLFRQVFENNQQTTIKDAWRTGDDWLVASERKYDVPFKNFTLRSTLYDIDVLGYEQTTRNRLRLFDLDSVSEGIISSGIDFDKTNIKENLTLFLYPDDSDRNGELLRIYQQYFMVSNGAQLIIDEALEKGATIEELADYAVIQINDTHPALVIPEMIRLLIERGMDQDRAIEMVQKMTAFTNHTILAEALEKWPLHDLEEVVPHLIPIIKELDARVKASYPDKQSVHIIDEQNRVHMAHMSIHYGFSVNGVAQLHTDILKESELKDFYELYPERFNNKTNGITFRRWVMAANPELSRYFDELLGKEWRNTQDLSALLSEKTNEAVKSKLAQIKLDNKVALKKHLELTQNVTINEHSIFDIQIKRIHEYKRQQMNALYIIHKYLDIKAGNIPNTPITLFFGGKAAPAYTIAQDVIHLILSLSELIAKDPEVSPHLQVVMIENYNVSHAEYLIPACDISEQISLASKEASGTGNMKFMLNGALTLGTMDGANVEIAELVDPENIYIFGKESDEIIKLYETAGYVSREYYELPAIKPLVDFIVSDEMKALGNVERLDRLYNELINKDWFMTLIDLENYIKVKEQMYVDYDDQALWLEKVIVNISKAGFFSSDRTISQYNDDIWHLEQ
ncbi:glycogen/starch/alpha-glucan family phosphorylase [Atopobacter phocae]|uniref:glycogen/starch/alpha-glucan family phosphorylase n=1 Tax=Atopobacter phocae TaxID=136492 RepID=UPI000471F324|nr:glycogen/starch/alpha-glucan phosphorylase [Atopobacter phocae]